MNKTRTQGVNECAREGQSSLRTSFLFPLHPALKHGAILGRRNDGEQAKIPRLRSGMRM